MAARPAASREAPPAVASCRPHARGPRGAREGIQGLRRGAPPGAISPGLPGTAPPGQWGVGQGHPTQTFPPRGTGAPSPCRDAPPLAHAQLGWPLSSHRQRPNLLRPLSTPHSLGQGPKEHFVPLARQDRPGHPARPGASLWAAWGAVHPEPQEGRPPSSPPRPRGPHWGSNPGQVGPRSSQDLVGRPSRKPPHSLQRPVLNPCFAPSRLVSVKDTAGKPRGGAVTGRGERSGEGQGRGRRRWAGAALSWGGRGRPLSGGTHGNAGDWVPAPTALPPTLQMRISRFQRVESGMQGRGGAGGRLRARQDPRGQSHQGSPDLL